LIGVRVSVEYLGVIAGMDAAGSVRTAWQESARMFQSVTNGIRMMLRQKVASLDMDPEESAAKYIARAKDLKRDLVQAHLDAKDVNIAAACGLSKEYREIRMMLGLQEKPINLDKMLSLLLHHEARFERDEEADTEHSNSIAFASRSFKKTFKTSKKGSGYYTCGEEGHRSYECEKNPHKNIICRNCQGKGHMARDCRRKKKEKKEEGGEGNKKTLAFMSTQDKNPSNCWILDS
jgi:hypothetical protein